MKQPAFRPIHAIMITGFILLGFLILSLTRQSLHRFLYRISLDYFYPMLKIQNAAESALGRTALTTGKSNQELADELIKLQNEYLRTSAENAVLKQLQKENDRLRMLLNLRNVPGFQPVIAEIIMRDSLTWNETFIVDKGAINGIRIGDCVLSVHAAPEGTGTVTAVAGRVTSVSEHTAQISTILREDCSFSVFLTESGQYGTLQGNGSGREPKISNLSIDGKYGRGEVVLTGGLSRQTPGGLYVGTLHPGKDGNVSHITNHLYAEAELKAAAIISELHFVAILTREELP